MTAILKKLLRFVLVVLSVTAITFLMMNLLPGDVSFRADGRKDSRCYEATLWLRGHTGPCSRYLLTELEAHERRWLAPPGSESPATARELGLPLAPGYEGDTG